MPPEGTPIDTTPPATTSPAAPAPQPVAPAAPAYSQEQLDAALKAQHDSLNADFRRKSEARQQTATPPSPGPTPTPTPAPARGEDTASIAQTVARETAFSHGVLTYGLNAQEVSLIRPAFDAAGLTDAASASAWMKENVKMLGKNPAAPTAPAAIAAPNVPAPIAPFAPSTVVVPLQRDVSVLEMPAEQIHDLIRKKGGDPSRPYHPSNRVARREIRTQYEAAMRGRRVRV